LNKNPFEVSENDVPISLDEEEKETPIYVANKSFEGK